METTIDLRKQKRLGPAPIASFEKSFEDNNQQSSNVNVAAGSTATTTNLQQMDASSNNGSSSTVPIATTSTATDDHKDRKIIKNDRPKVSPPDPPTIQQQRQQQQQQQRPKIAVCPTPTRKFQDVGGKRPPTLQQQHRQQQQLNNVSTIGASTTDDTLVKPANLGLTTPATPRIDISRASSSSHHEDSRESSPENVFEQVGTGTLQEAIGLGFREDGALDLRSSTEELYFMDPQQKKEEKEKMQQVRKSPVNFKFEDHQTYLQQHQRKDSASSEVAALLCISGRTSRISSVGSQGSAVSRLSAISGVSGISGVSRSPSPHRMLLETSFCGPKPLENNPDGSILNSTQSTAAATLENVLLARKHDPTSVVLAEGIQIETSPKRKMLANGGAKKKSLSHEKATSADYNLIKTISSNVLSSSNTKSIPRKTHISSARRDSGKQVIGVTESGTKYIRINLKPDHLYSDKGIAPNEKIIEVSSGGPSTSSSSSFNKIQDKPATLQINRESGSTDRLTPHSSPKPARHIALTKETAGISGTGSRSPSPAQLGSVARKSSFCASLFKPKDGPDSPRVRSKSRDIITPQSQTGTPNKQKSVLAIFKPKRSGSKSKCSSPIDQDAMTQLDAISQVEFKFNTDPNAITQDRSRPASRLRYYDTPSDGQSIHIPLHTPPEEKEAQKMLPGHHNVQVTIQRPMSAPVSSPSAVSFPKETKVIIEPVPPALPVKAPRPLQLEKLQRIENLDAIHSLPQDVKDKERTWSLEVQRNSSQDSQETVISADSIQANNCTKKTKVSLENVIESPVKENGVLKQHPNPPSEPPPDPPLKTTPPNQSTTSPITAHKVTVQQSQQQQQQQQQQQLQQQQQQQPALPVELSSKEKKRILFATRIGSGSQEQIFSTQFSLSKTESLSSQLSEQTSIPESPAEGREAALHRSDTVIRRTDELKKKNSSDEHKSESNKSSFETIKKDSSIEEFKQKVKSSEDEDKRPIVVKMRKKDSSTDSKRKSKSASEEDDPTNRHSKYLENFDVRKRFQDNQKRQPTRNSSDSSIKESRSNSREEPDATPKIFPKLTKPPPSVSPLLPPPPPSTSDRQLSANSTDEPIESSESERDSEMDPNRVKRHLPRHIGIIEDHESTGLVSQESFDDELPYVPTTLPEERAQGIALIPMKERTHMDVKTFSLDRPRSTTPMNPAHLEEYCGNVTPDETEHSLIRGEKLRISLPRRDQNAHTRTQVQKSKSPRRTSNSSGKSWFEFAEQGIRGTTTNNPTGTTNTTAATTTITTPTQSDDVNTQIDEKFVVSSLLSSSPPPPPLPPRKPSTTSITSGQWVNFENIPEKRKAPKRITVLPKELVPVGQDANNKTQEPIHYNYVKPEECQCECHESERESTSVQKPTVNVDLLNQNTGEDLQPLLDSDCHEGIDPSDSSQDYDYGPDEQQSSDERRKYEIETPSSMRNSRSNRSSGHSDGHESSSPDHRSGSNSKRSQPSASRYQ